ncbi:MAG: glycosyltransferase family 4 protein [Pleurocapsa sp.]
MKILMLSTTFPYPPSKGGTQVRTFNLIKHFSKEHQITLITQKSGDVTSEDIANLQQQVDKLEVFPQQQEVKSNLVGKIRRFGKFIAQGTPPNVLYSYSPKIQQWVDKAVTSNEFDAVTCEHSVNEIYIRPQWQRRLKTVVNIHSSVYRTCQNQLETVTSENPIRDRFYLPLLRRYEQNFCQKFSQIVVTTAEDKQQILQLYPQGKVDIVTNGVDLTTFPYREKDPGGHNLIFCGGMDYVANIDAACFFCTEVFPQLKQLYPDLTMSVVGSKPTAKVLALAEIPGVKVTGRVPSIVEYLHQATVCIVPMRTGFGIKNKTLEAMAAGTPIVASDRGLEGLNTDNPPLALRANTVEEYITAISRLLDDVELRSKLSYNAKQTIERQFTWSSLARLYEQIIIHK